MSDIGWNIFAQEWNQAMQHGDWFQRYIIYPALIDHMGEVAEKKIIDIGCGNGHISRMLNEHGAIVTGVDNSSAMIQICRGYNDSIKYENLDITEAPVFTQLFDWAIFSNSLQSILNYEMAIKNTYHLLINRGELMIVIKHPCFHPANPELGWTLQYEDGEIRNSGNGLNSLMKEKRNYTGQYYKMDNYYSRDDYLRKWFNSFSQTYTRTIEDYVMTIISNNFELLGIYEPKPIEEGYNEQPQLYELLQRIPNFLVIHAKKRL